MHSMNLTEVYYDAIYVSGEEKADILFGIVKNLPITILWNLDTSLIKLVGKYKTSYKVFLADCFVLALANQENATVILTGHHEFDIIENSENLSFYWLR